jgi:hypothetical protein
MTKTLFVALAALMLTVGVASAESGGYGQQSQTGAYAAGGTASSTRLNEGSGAH